MIKLSTQSISGLGQLSEEVEDELMGEDDDKDAGGPGEAPTDELRDSGVWPAKTHTQSY